MAYPLSILIHVVFGTLWAGGAVALGFFIFPAVIEAGPAGGAVMGGVAKRQLPVYFSAFAILTVLSGLYLIHVRSSANPEFFTSAEGMVLSLGALLGLGAFGLGLGIQRPTAMRIGALGAQIAQQGGQPTPEQIAELGVLRPKLLKIAKVVAFHLLGSVVCMAAHRLAAGF